MIVRAHRETFVTTAQPVAALAVLLGTPVGHLWLGSVTLGLMTSRGRRLGDY